MFSLRPFVFLLFIFNFGNHCSSFMFVDVVRSDVDKSGQEECYTEAQVEVGSLSHFSKGLSLVMESAAAFPRG